MQSYPPTFLDALLEATNFIDRAAHDDGMTKADLCASMETRLSLTDIPVRLAITVVTRPLACLPVAGSQGHPFKFRQSDAPVRATG